MANRFALYEQLRSTVAEYRHTLTRSEQVGVRLSESEKELLSVVQTEAICSIAATLAALEHSLAAVADARDSGPRS